MLDRVKAAFPKGILNWSIHIMFVQCILNSVKYEILNLKSQLKWKIHNESPIVELRSSSIFCIRKCQHNVVPNTSNFLLIEPSLFIYSAGFLKWLFHCEFIFWRHYKQFHVTYIYIIYHGGVWVNVQKVWLSEIFARL